MGTNISQSNYAVDTIFKPNAGLLQRYSRYADADELEDLQVQFDGLQQALLLAQSHSDIYEASCVRNDLRELRGTIVDVIALREDQKVVLNQLGFQNT